MKTKTLLWVFLIFTTASAFGQGSLPPVYEINADTSVEKIPDFYWQMLVDTMGKWSINDVTHPPVSDRFYRNNTNQYGFGFTEKHYWQRLRLKNSTDKEVKLVFSSKPPTDKQELFIFRQAAEPEHYVQGYFVPWDERDGLKGFYSIPVPLNANEVITLYKKLYIDRMEPSRRLYIGYNNYDEFIQRQYIDAPWYTGNVLWWLMAGIFIFGFFFNLFFFWIVRDRVYFYMALLLLTEGIWYVLYDWNVVFRNNFYFKNTFMFFATHLIFFFSVLQFVRYFLKLPRYYPKWDRSLIIFFVITEILVLLTFGGSPIMLRYSYSLGGLPVFVAKTFFFLFTLSLLMTFIFFRKEKDKLNNLAIIAAIPALLVWSFGYYILAIGEFVTRTYDTASLPVFRWYASNVIIEMFCVAFFAILFTWILLQRYAQLRKKVAVQALEREREKTEMINRQKEELEAQVEQRTAALKHSLQELQATQKQLIQSEKMASLGELTAGIAHEIQNPLNFVNNFSEVSTELIEEMKQELATGNQQQATEIADDLKQNLEKIINHGKRADAIVKGMLQHSRASSGQKELTDINALCDEYLRLSYHGLRAKDKSFNAKFETDFDPSLPKINVVPQDIGRVILNLINNAFYAASLPSNEGLSDSENNKIPTVWVRTAKIPPSGGGGALISVRDNGPGIPETIKDKIFQPFFTTKPTGQGTGLGLSLSYDIIKAHGGEIKVETKEGEGTQFTIQLPYNYKL